MSLTFAPVATERAERLLEQGGARGVGLRLIREFLAYVEQSGEQSAEISPAELDAHMTVKGENGQPNTQRKLRPSEVVQRVHGAAETHNYAVVAVPDSGKVVLIRTAELPDPSRDEGTVKEREASQDGQPAKRGRRSKQEAEATA